MRIRMLGTLKEEEAFELVKGKSVWQVVGEEEKGKVKVWLTCPHDGGRNSRPQFLNLDPNKIRVWVLSQRELEGHAHHSGYELSRCRWRWMCTTCSAQGTGYGRIKLERAAQKHKGGNPGHETVTERQIAAI